MKAWTVPLLSDVACPEQRGPGKPTIAGECSQDADCADGCFNDSACSDNEPYSCRESATLNTPNICVAGIRSRIFA